MKWRWPILTYVLLSSASIYWFGVLPEICNPNYRDFNSPLRISFYVPVHTSFFLIFKNKSSFKNFYPGNNKYYSGFNETGFLPCGVEKLAWINTLWSCWDLCRGGRAGGRITASFLCSSTTGSCSAPGRNWALCLKGLSELGKKKKKKNKKKTHQGKKELTLFSANRAMIWSREKSDKFCINIFLINKKQCSVKGIWSQDADHITLHSALLLSH